MNSNLSHQTLRERLVDAHSRIRAADVGQLIAALLGKPRNAIQRKAARLRILRVIKPLVDSGELDCCSAVRPFISSNDIVLADEPFIRWSPGEQRPRFDLFTLEFHFFRGKGLLPVKPGRVAKFTEQSVFTRQIGSPNVRLRSVNYPWVNIYVTSAATIRANYGRESPVPEFFHFPEKRYGHLELFMLSMGSASLPPRVPLVKAELCVDHQLMATAIYFQILKRSPDHAARWVPYGLIGPPGDLGKTPDAFITQADGPGLAIGYAGPLTDLAAIHRFCEERGMPYELWGHRHAEAWYNPSCQIAYVKALRDEVFSALGPVKYAPALAATNTDGDEKD